MFGDRGQEVTLFTTSILSNISKFTPSGIKGGLLNTKKVTADHEWVIRF